MKFESYRQSAGHLERGINPVARPLPKQNNKNTEETQTDIRASSGNRTTIQVVERDKTFHALDRAATVIDFHNFNGYK
jgi:F420-0:gamma-glutamyl ligase-like protein